MNVALWAEIRRLAEIEKLSGRAIARRLHCSRHTVAAALELDQPPARRGLAPRQPPGSVHGQDRCPAGQVSRPLGRAHPRGDRPWPRGLYRQRDRRSPLPADQSVPHAGVSTRKSTTSRPRRCKSIGASAAACKSATTTRKVSVFVAVLCYSRLMFIEFTLSQRKAEFYRSLVQRPRVLRRQSPRRDLRQPEGGRAQRLGPRRLFPSRVPGIVRLLLHAADRLRTPRPGIERDRRGRRALRQAQRPGGTGRGTDPLRGLPGLGALLARPGGQRADARDDPRAADRSLSSTSARCCARCRRSPSTPTKSCRPSSLPMHASSSTAIATRRRRSWCAGPSRFAPTVMSSACCTKARWWPSMSAATSADS